jgi:hypothetical protein
MRKLAFAFAMLAGNALAQPLPPDTPLVKSGPVTVTAQDFEAQMLRIPESMRGEARASLDRVASMTDTLFVNRMLAAEAAKAGFLDDPLVRLRGQQVLEAYQARAWLDHLEKDYKHPKLEARAREIYLSDRAKYQVAETYAVEHILIGLWGRTKEMALERINEARAKIAAGADFNAVALEYSTDPKVKQNGGKLGTSSAKELDSEIAQLLPKLKVGEVSAPVFTRAGYHLVRITARNPGRAYTFEEVKETIMEDERGRVLKRSADDRLQALRNKPETRIDVEAMKKLVVEVPREEIERVHREQREAAKAAAEKGAAGKAAPKAP